jgi:cupin fold WbuC family metalloprotein
MVDEIAIYEKSFFKNLKREVDLSERARCNYNLHLSYDDLIQKFFNMMRIDSYIQPHRHLGAAKLETLIQIEGEFLVVLFDDCGGITRVLKLGDSNDFRVSAVEIPPDRWHTVVCVSDYGILFELKEGPYVEELAKEFAEWAPKPGSEFVEEYLAGLRTLQFSENAE